MHKANGLLYARVLLSRSAEQHEGCNTSHKHARQGETALRTFVAGAGERGLPSLGRHPPHTCGRGGRVPNAPDRWIGRLCAVGPHGEGTGTRVATRGGRRVGTLTLRPAWSGGARPPTVMDTVSCNHSHLARRIRLASNSLTLRFLACTTPSSGKPQREAKKRFSEDLGNKL